MRLELEVALAYLRSRPSRLVSAVSLLAISGIALGVAALVVAMGLLSGYRSEIREKLVGANAEVVVYPLAPASPEDIRNVRARIGKVPGVRATAPVVYQTGLASSATSPDGVDVVLKGIDLKDEARVSPRVASSLGEFDAPGAAGTASVAVGAELARRLDVRRGDAITLSVADASSQATGFVPRTGRFRVASVFRTNFAEYDSEWIFLDRENLRALTRMDGAANVVEVGLAPETGRDETLESLENDARDVVRRTVLSRWIHVGEPAPTRREQALAAIRSAAGDRFSVADTLAMNAGLFAALRVQQTTLFIVIGLIVGVATFNVVATLVMTVQEKKRDIGVLSAIGAAPRFFSRLFLCFGGMLGGTGVVAGILFGSLLCWALTASRLLSFPPGVAEIYFVSFIPFRVRAIDLGSIVACSTVVILLAAWLPARRAARLDVAEALRYE
jgi:lipoprotein-releasing system permease protein